MAAGSAASAGLVAEKLLGVPQPEQAGAGRTAEPIGLGMQRLRFGQRTRRCSACLKCLCLEEFPSHGHKLSTGL